MLRKIMEIVSEKHIHGYDELMDELLKLAGEDPDYEQVCGYAVDHHGALNDYFTAGKLDRISYQLEMLREQMKYLR